MASEVTTRPVEWFWKPFIPLGKVTLLAGEPETGKSWISLWIAAMRSRGEQFPFGRANYLNGTADAFASSKRSMLLNAEDDPDDTIVPRLQTMGADLQNILVLADSDDIARPWALDTAGMQKLDDAVTEHQPSLLIIDPINAWFGAGSDMYRPNDVRQFMGGLQRIARKHMCAVLVIGHMTKGNRASARDKILGSVDFVAASRSVLVFKRHTRQRVLMSHVKHSNLPESERIETLEYELAGNGPNWLGTTTLHVDDLIAGDAEAATGRGSNLQSAEQWLDEQLADGRLSVKELKRRATREEISMRTLERARSASRVNTYKEGKHWYVERGAGDEAANATAAVE